MRKYILITAVMLGLLPSMVWADEYNKFIRFTCIPEISYFEISTININTISYNINTANVSSINEKLKNIGLFDTSSLGNKTFESKCNIKGDNYKAVIRPSSSKKIHDPSGIRSTVTLELYKNNNKIYKNTKFNASDEYSDYPGSESLIISDYQIVFCEFKHVCRTLNLTKGE